MVHVSNEDINQLREEYANSIPFAGLAPLLGIGLRMALRMRDELDIPVWIQGGKHGDKHRYVFRRADVEMWVDKLVGDPPYFPELPNGCSLLADTPNRKNFRIDHLISAIREGRVTIAGRLTGREKFGGTILDDATVETAVPAEIRRKMGNQRRGSRGGSYRKALPKA
jgi:hypothetical protein